MIAEYENDELALDSDDEKKLARAEKEAEKKAARKKPKLPAAIAAPLLPAAAGDAVPPVRRFGAAVPVPAKIGPCFVCGEFGHLRRYCSKPCKQNDGMFEYEFKNTMSKKKKKKRDKIRSRAVI